MPIAPALTRSVVVHQESSALKKLYSTRDLPDVPPHSVYCLYYNRSVQDIERKQEDVVIPHTIWNRYSK